MQNNSQTYEQQILPGTKAGSTCSQEVFPASRFQLPDNKKEPKMTATCGPKCSELFGLFDPVGSWARTFTGLLVGRTGWYSNRCALTWKRKVTKSSRMYFQLAVSALHTKGTGHGLLPTAQTQGLKMCENGKTKFYPVGLLPTPKVQDCRHARERQGQEQPRRRNERVSIPPNWRNFPTQSPVRRGDDGLSDWLDFDAVFEGILTPRRAKAYNRWREQAIKAYGNAVVPQVVLQIFETINEYEALSRAERSGK